MVSSKIKIKSYVPSLIHYVSGPLIMPAVSNSQPPDWLLRILGLVVAGSVIYTAFGVVSAVLRYYKPNPSSGKKGDSSENNVEDKDNQSDSGADEDIGYDFVREQAVQRILVDPHLTINEKWERINEIRESALAIAREKKKIAESDAQIRSESDFDPNFDDFDFDDDDVELESYHFQNFSFL